MGWGTDVLQDLKGPGMALQRQIPEVYGAFAHLSKVAVAPGALDTKTKELIAIACAIIQKCDGCIASHARAAARAGATEQEVAEAIGVAVLLGGGPSTVYGPRAFEAFQEFAERFGPR